MTILSVILAGIAVVVTLVILSFLPAIPAAAISALTFTVTLGKSVNNILPVGTAFTVISLILTIELTILAVKGVRFLWVRIASGSSSE